MSWGFILKRQPWRKFGLHCVAFYSSPSEELPPPGGISQHLGRIMDTRGVAVSSQASAGWLSGPRLQIVGRSVGIVHAIGVQACKLADLIKTTTTTATATCEERENFPAKKNSKVKSCEKTKRRPQRKRKSRVASRGLLPFLY